MFEKTEAILISERTSDRLFSMGESYLSLRELEPDHSLLRLVNLSEDKKVFSFTGDYGEKFVHKDDKFREQSYSRYLDALDTAILIAEGS